MRVVQVVRGGPAETLGLDAADQREAVVQIELETTADPAREVPTEPVDTAVTEQRHARRNAKTAAEIEPPGGMLAELRSTTEREAPGLAEADPGGAHHHGMLAAEVLGLDTDGPVGAVLGADANLATDITGRMLGAEPLDATLELYARGVSDRDLDARADATLDAFAPGLDSTFDVDMGVVPTVLAAVLLLDLARVRANRILGTRWMCGALERRRIEPELVGRDDVGFRGRAAQGVAELGST